MTVRIKHGKLRLALWVPTSCIGFAVKCAVKSKRWWAKEDDEILNVLSNREIHEIAKNLRKAKKIHGKLELVRIEAADGTKVKIVL